jgi:hypothetical protein
MEKAKWVAELMRAKSFVLATDKGAVCNVPMADPYTMDSVVYLAAQHSSLVDFRDRLNRVIEEHEALSQSKFGVALSVQKTKPRAKARNKGVSAR